MEGANQLNYEKWFKLRDRKGTKGTKSLKEYLFVDLFAKSIHTVTTLIFSIWNISFILWISGWKYHQRKETMSIFFHITHINISCWERGNQFFNFWTRKERGSLKVWLELPQMPKNFDISKITQYFFLVFCVKLKGCKGHLLIVNSLFERSNLNNVCYMIQFCCFFKNLITLHKICR